MHFAFDMKNSHTCIHILVKQCRHHGPLAWGCRASDAGYAWIPISQSRLTGGPPQSARGLRGQPSCCAAAPQPQRRGLRARPGARGLRSQPKRRGLRCAAPAPRAPQPAGEEEEASNSSAECSEEAPSSPSAEGSEKAPSSSGAQQPSRAKDSEEAPSC